MSRTEMKVVSAIVDLAEQYIELGDYDGAAWAAERGLRALPADAELTKLLIEAHCRAGDKNTARKVFDSHLVVLDSLQIDEVDDELMMAYEEMIHASS